MNFVCLSHPIIEKNGVRFSGNPNNIIKRVTSVQKNDSNTFKASIFSHNSTHLDTPYHFFSNGKELKDYNINDLIFTKVQVLSIRLNYGQLITENDMKMLHIEPNTEALLLKSGLKRTTYSSEYVNNSPGFYSSAALWLRSKTNIKLLGIDWISISSPSHIKEGIKSHKIFLREGSDKKPILLLEDVNMINLLDDVKIKRLFIVPFIQLFPDGGPVTVLAEI